MDIKLAPDDPQSMSQDGDSILRSLQNNSLPIIDLMVRESLQNSLDATLEDSKQTCVDFKLGKFNSTNLSKHLTGVTDVLDKNYQTQQEFIAISDKNTTGLTGDFRSKDLSELNKSNFQKLIFGIGKNQEAEGAGGSWGLGKTSYFRLGIGIVIYYTRVAIPACQVCGSLPGSVRVSSAWSTTLRSGSTIVISPEMTWTDSISQLIV